MNNFFTGLAIVIIIAGGAWYYFAHKNNPQGGTGGPYACTMDAKICPDGSTVGRTGPRCEFAACPAETPHSAEQALVQAYVKENINSIATNEPVLGGKWYVVSVTVNPVANKGTIVYEDGHIQATTNFAYVIQGDGVVVTPY